MNRRWRVWRKPSASRPTASPRLPPSSTWAASAGIPPNLSSVGVTEEFIPQMSNDAYQSGNAQLVNPRKPTLADVEMLYRQAL